MLSKNLILTLLILVLSASVDAEIDYLTLEWRYNAGGGITSIYLSDLDRDGYKEIMAGSYDGNIYLLDRKGNLRWRYYVFCPVYSVHAADLNSDGNEEIITGSCRPVHVLNTSRDLRWRFTTSGKVRYLSAEDLDDDGDKELMIASDSGRVNNFYVLDKDGNPLWKKTFRGAYPQSVYVTDLDGDGHKEVLIGAGILSVFDNAGNKRWTYKTGGRVAYLSATDKEIFVGSYPYLYVLNTNGTLNREYKTSGMVESVYVTDLDNDGTDEIIVGSDKLYLFNKDGNLIWDYDTGSDIHLVHAEDLDKDGYKEIMVGSDRVYILNRDGNLEWEYPTYRSVTGLQVVDLDGDGYDELIVGSMDHNVYVFKVRGVYLKERKNETKSKEEMEAEVVSTTIPEEGIENQSDISPSPEPEATPSTGVDYTVYLLLLIILSFAVFLLSRRRS